MKMSTSLKWCIGFICLFTFSAVSQTGSILREYWTGISGIDVSNLTSNSNYPNNPSGKEYLTGGFEGPVNWNDNYGTRIRGYVHPPTSGYYTFWISGDDKCELWLSIDDKQSHKRLIATVPVWTNSREWTKFPEQQSASIYLELGKRYYIEALHKEGSGGDNIAVGWQLPGSVYDRPISANRLSPVADDDDYSLWKDTAKIILNTTSSGIPINQNLIHFPMLIRLNSSNFNFDSAKIDGSDIRFARPDGTHLKYQIERWNKTLKIAEVWVSVDTVYANNSTQYITMLWGKSDAVSHSSGTAVYDSSFGYRGVWHLNQNPGGTSPQFTDASSTLNRGTAQGAMNSADSVTAVVDKGVDLDGTDDYITTSLLYSNPKLFTLSLWMKTTSVKGGKLIGLGNQQVGSSSAYDRHIYMDTLGHIYFGVFGSGSARTISTSSSYNNGVWHHVTATFSSSGMKLYVDGSLQASSTNTVVDSIAGYWRIGYDNLMWWPGATTSYYWQGILDEATVCYTEKNSDWIKLSYENQKNGSTFPAISITNLKPLVTISSRVAAVPETSLAVDAISITATRDSRQSTPLPVPVRLICTGSAQSGVDYQALNSPVTVTIPADSLLKTNILSLIPIVDTLNEGNETLYVAIAPDTLYRSDSTRIAIVIIDNDQKYPPTVTSGPDNRSAREGDECTFTVNVSGTQPFTYQWRLNGTLVDNTNSALFNIFSVPLSYNGATVDCIVSNSLGKDTSRTAILNVSARPQAPVVTRHPEPILAVEGDTAVFNFQVTGTQPFTYQWYCNNSAISGAVDSILRIRTVLLNDNGKRYYCQITNSESSVLTNTALLTVKRPSSHTIIITGDLLTSSYTKVGLETETKMNFIVRLYPSVTSDSILYTESFLDTNNQAIVVKNGKFAIQLGSGQTNGDLMDVVRNNANIFVSFTISRPGGNEETLNRRVPLTSSPYALSSLPQLLKGNVNPDSAGIEAPIGTHYIRTTTNATYIKTYLKWVELK
jgi:hypothetical protein